MKQYYINKYGKEVEYEDISEIPNNEFSETYYMDRDGYCIYGSIWGPLLVTNLFGDKNG